MYLLKDCIRCLFKKITLFFILVWVLVLVGCDFTSLGNSQLKEINEIIRVQKDLLAYDEKFLQLRKIELDKFHRLKMDICVDGEGGEKIIDQSKFTIENKFYDDSYLYNYVDIEGLSDYEIRDFSEEDYTREIQKKIKLEIRKANKVIELTEIINQRNILIDEIKKLTKMISCSK